MQCEQIADLLPQLVDTNEAADPTIVRHVESCLHCQAELVQYRKLLKSLRLLRTEVLEPAPGLVADVLAGLEGRAERVAIRSMLNGRKVAYIGGIAVATAAAGAGALVYATRARKALRPAG